MEVHLSVAEKSRMELLQVREAVDRSCRVVEALAAVSATYDHSDLDDEVRSSVASILHLRTRERALCRALGVVVGEEES